jgi:hypothetical protein
MHGNLNHDIVMEDRSFQRIRNASSEAVIARLRLLYGMRDGMRGSSREPGHCVAPTE